MIGILFATDMEAKPFLDRGEPEGTVTVISGMGMEAARSAAEKLIKEHGCTSVINAGVCGALNNRLERGGAGGRRSRFGQEGCGPDAGAIRCARRAHLVAHELP